ncbi:hypothetical protein FHR88_000515 [Bradyrhizobium betae]|nr:hypothetical protein [Bradyrhizobium betae]
MIDPDDDDDLDAAEVEPDDPDAWRDYSEEPDGDELDG